MRPRLTSRAALGLFASIALCTACKNLREAIDPDREGGPPGETSAEPDPATPIGIVRTWENAIRGGDRAAAAACLAVEVRDAREYASDEALHFWRAQLQQMDGRGFRGEWRVTETNDAPSNELGAKTVVVAPVLGDATSDEGIQLVEEADGWRIRRLF